MHLMRVNTHQGGAGLIHRFDLMLGPSVEREEESLLLLRAHRV
jgi:hypothetical protein